MYSFKVNTITNAQMASKMLKAYGIKSKIGRIKNPSKSEGCGYTVDVECDDYVSINEMIESRGIKVSGIEII